ncbi:MAG: hypothetical protein KGL95_05545 [Patescibacteria group bacterium]|nr:hypothetical protein [Patescibacteria group bacterium]
MATIVVGSLILSNGQSPHIFIEVEGYAVVNNEKTEYVSKIIGSHIIIEFPNSLKNENETDDIFRISRHIIDNMILSQTVIVGSGLSYTVEYCKKSNVEMILATPDHAPDDKIKIPDLPDIYQIIGENSEIRYAIRDFNSGLIDRENCPLYFYRCIESLAKSITKKEDNNLESKDWEQFHSVLETKREDMKTLEEFNPSHRHGSHSFFTKEQHLEMMKETQFFIKKVLNHLKKN